MKNSRILRGISQIDKKNLIPRVFSIFSNMFYWGSSKIIYLSLSNYSTMVHFTRNYKEYFYILKKLLVHKILSNLLLIIGLFEFLIYLWNVVVTTRKLEDVWAILYSKRFITWWKTIFRNSFHSIELFSRYNSNFFWIINNLYFFKQN